MVTARCSLSTEIMTGQRLEQACTAELIDGSVILLRQLELSDAEEILVLYESLTDEERYFRFFAMHPAHLEDWARSIAEPRDDQYSLGAFSSGKLLGVANYVACEAARIRRGGGGRGTRRTPSRRRYRVVAPARTTSRGQTDCIIWLPRCSGRTTSCFGCFRRPAGPAPDTLKVRCYTSRSTWAWSPPLAKR